MTSDWLGFVLVILLNIAKGSINTLVVELIGQRSRHVIGRLSVKPCICFSLCLPDFRELVQTGWVRCSAGIVLRKKTRQQ